MKIKSITMENFRPYYGKQKIEFSQGENNITIIFGENGGGKTSLYRAIVFALFGDRHLEQVDKTNVVHFVNRKAIDESPDTPVIASAQIEFDHNDFNYIIKRSVKGIRFNGNLMEELDSAEMVIIDSEGNANAEPITNVDKINLIVERIINEKIKNFFFFDGEQIDTLTTTKDNKRDSVKAGIYNASQLDSLKDSLEILNSVQVSIENQIKSSSQKHNIKDAIDKKQKIEGDNKSRKIEVEKENSYILNLEDQLNTLETRFSENNDARDRKSVV